MVFIK
jgi:hypothetical protein